MSDVEVLVRHGPSSARACRNHNWVEIDRHQIPSESGSAWVVRRQRCGRCGRIERVIQAP